eukprot:2764992-Rhodomonas_salina.2
MAVSGRLNICRICTTTLPNRPDGYKTIRYSLFFSLPIHYNENEETSTSPQSIFHRNPLRSPAAAPSSGPVLLALSHFRTVRGGTRSTSCPGLPSPLAAAASREKERRGPALALLSALLQLLRVPSAPVKWLVIR